MTIKQLCEWLGVSRRFVEKEIESGRLRVRRLSRRMIRIMPADLKAWLDGDSQPSLNSTDVRLRDSAIAGEANH
jgi:excisionase family DNA binding protein